MSATIISGREISKTIREELKARVAELTQEGLVPGLATVLVGDDPASHQYVGMKNKAAGAAGIYSRQVTLPASTPEDELLGLIDGAERRSRDPRHLGAAPATGAHRRVQGARGRRSGQRRRRIPPGERGQTGDGGTRTFWPLALPRGWCRCSSGRGSIPPGSMP